MDKILISFNKCCGCDKMNKVLCTFGIGEHERLLEHSFPLMQKYAKKHNFDTYTRTTTTKFKDEPHFEKIQIILDLMNDYDYIFYLDVDILFNNFDKNIMDFVKDNVWLYIVQEPLGYYNSGVMLIKTCKESRLFFEEVINIKEKVYEDPNWENLRNIWYDQACILKLLGVVVKRNENYKTYISESPYNKNLFILPNEWNRIVAYENAKKEDIIIHYAGAIPFNTKIECIKNKRYHWK